MANDDQDQRTEFPTFKRLTEARERGQLPISREAATWVLFVGILLVVTWVAPPMAAHMVTSLRVFLEMPHAISLDGNGMQVMFAETLRHMGLATVLVFAILAAAAALGTILQTGLYASLETIRPQFDRVSPMAGFKRLFSANSLIELGKSFGKLIVLGGIVFLTLWPVMENLPASGGHDLMDIVAYLHHQAVHMIIMLMLAFTLIAILDLMYQRHQYIKGLKMTKAEVKDEFKQQEGDPIIKMRLRNIRVEKARKRMMAQVPKADVVVTNPTHYAVALQYDNENMDAPVVLAKGINLIADRIREIANENKIPLVSNPPLARALYDTVELDQQIPSMHYRAVAEIISYVYKLKKKRF